MRFNRTNDSYFEIKKSRDSWDTHDHADVAAILILPNMLPKGMVRKDVGGASLDMRDFMGPGPDYEVISEHPIYGPISIKSQVGAEIYFAGLFSQHPGHEKILPIARFGHIARMPSEITMPRTGGTSFEAEAYLMESHSWGGHSGSSTFIAKPTFVDRLEGSDGVFITDLVWTHAFIGLVSGHFEIDAQAKPTGDVMDTLTTALNSGMAIVTPAHKVTELLMRDDVVEARIEAVEKYKGPVAEEE